MAENGILQRRRGVLPTFYLEKAWHLIRQGDGRRGFAALFHFYYYLPPACPCWRNRRTDTWKRLLPFTMNLLWLFAFLAINASTTTTIFAGNALKIALHAAAPARTCCNKQEENRRAERAGTGRKTELPSHLPLLNARKYSIFGHLPGSLLSQKQHGS